MEIRTSGLPIHTDATVKIRPRIFLEGNWFVELQPGSPSAPTLSSGDTIPVTQTSDPVQLDQVLDALNTDTRAEPAGLPDRLRQRAHAQAARPPKKPNRNPKCAALNGAAGAQQVLPPRHRSRCAAARSSTRRSTGTEPHDLSKLIASIGKVTAALNVHEQQLGELFPNFNTFFRRLRRAVGAAAPTVAELPIVAAQHHRGLRRARTRIRRRSQAFAHDIIPGVKLTPSTVKATLPWIEQLRLSLGPNELGGVAKGLDAAAPALAQAAGRTDPALPADRTVQQVPDAT